MNLISLIVTVALVTSAVVGEALKKDCKVIWEKYGNMQVKGLTEQTAIKTEHECKSACEASDNCWNIDFNFREISCWHGSVHKPQDRTVDASVHHWDLTKDCTDYQIVKTECVLSWEKYEKTQVVGLSAVPEATNEEDCKKACEASGDCWNIDFNFAEVSCWHGSVHRPTGRTPDDTVNHWDMSKDCPVNLPADCGAIQHADPTAKSGTYAIKLPGSTTATQVYCDMDTSGGGWTVIQRRKDGSENFERKWADYKSGFGKLTGEFWLGNDALTALTNAKPYILRFDLESPSGVKSFAEYNNFKVANEAAKYQLSFSSDSYTGTASNALGGVAPNAGNFNLNGMKFSTIDQDNDKVAGSCAQQYHGGWWYNGCHSCNPNGRYGYADDTGLNWNNWTVSMKFTEMKIRSCN